MDESHGGASSLPPFLTKTYEMVEDPSCDPVVSWSQGNKSFIVWNPPEFARDLLPRFFKHNNFSSFIRQLNTYGFRKIDPEQWEFANEDFIRGQPHLMKNIHRRKPVHSHSVQSIHGQGGSLLSDQERQSLKDEIERLTHDKEALGLELKRFEDERKGYEKQMDTLKEKLQQMEQKQQAMVSFVACVLQKPGLALNLMPQMEGHDRKRRMLTIDYPFSSDEPCIDDSRIVASQAPDRENIEGNSVASSSVEHNALESSLSFWENIVDDISGDSPNQPNSHMDLEESNSCCLDSQDASSIQVNVDLRPKSPGIDMNVEPVVASAPEPVPSEDHAVVTAPTVVTGVNDVFWEQFLTENPGSADMHEVQSAKKDSDGKKNDIKPSDRGKFWWNMRSVNNLAEQMGHLTPAERT